MNKKLIPVHPGEVLLEEFLKPMGISQNHMALKIGVPARRINEIVLRKRRITADTALRLAKYFGTTAKFWLGLQTDYDLDVAADELGERLEREVIEYANARQPVRDIKAARGSIAL
jgi:addiction module HigA family antidote